MTRHPLPLTRAIALVLTLSAALSGCLRPRATPPIRYFTLATQVSAPASVAHQVGIAAVVAEPSYASSRMATRPSPHRIAYSTFDRWAAPPAALVTSALERCFTRPVERETRPRVILTGRLHRFEGVTYGDAPHAVVGLTLTAELGGTVLLSTTWEETSPIGGSDPEVVAAALSTALDRILADFAAQLASRLAAA